MSDFSGRQENQVKNGLKRVATIELELSEVRSSPLEIPDTDDVFDPNDPSHYPDGGWRAYSVVVGSFLGLLVAYGILNAVGTIQNYLHLHQLVHVSTTKSSLVFSLFLSITYVSFIFSGVLFDEFGSTAPMVLGTSLLFIGLFCTGECQSLVAFIFCFSVICGIGIGTLSSPLTAVISHWFLRHRSKAFGLATLGGSIGGIVITILLDRLYPSVGFRWSMRILAFGCAAILAISCLLIKDRLPKRTRQNSDAGPLQRVGTVLMKLAVLLKKSVNFSSLKDVKFLFCCLAESFSEIALECTFTYIGSYVTLIGYNESRSNMVITVMNSAGIAGRIVPGIFADKYGCYNVMVAMSVGSTLSIFFVWLAWSTTSANIQSAYCFAVFYGFFSSSILSLAPTCIGSISPTKEFGQRYGTVYFMSGIFLFAGLSVASAIIGHSTLQSYRSFIGFSGAGSLVGTISWFLSRYAQVGFKFNVVI